MLKYCLLMTFYILPLVGANKEEILEDILSRYTRNATVLEIGGQPQETIYKIAQSFPDSVFIIMGKGQASYVEKVQQEDVSKNMIWLNCLPTFEYIQALSLSEHFDIIILNHLNGMTAEEWEKTIFHCQNMSHHVVVAPLEEDKERPSVLENHLPFSLTKRSCVHPPTIKRSFTVYFDYDQKFLVKVRPPYADQTTIWKPGINLITFLAFNGYYPDRASIILNLPYNFTHRDWMPNNMIMQGKNIVLIDEDDPANEPGGSGGWSFCQDKVEHIKLLIVESLDKSAEEVKLLFCKIFRAMKLLQVEAAD